MDLCFATTDKTRVCGRTVLLGLVSSSLQRLLSATTMISFSKIFGTIFVCLSLVAANQAPKIKQNPRNVVAIADFPQGFSQTVLGNVIFTARDGKFVEVHVDMTGLPAEGGPFQFHIHQGTVPANGDCDQVGDHLNPYNGHKDCELQKDDSYCEIGDLSGKHGWINATCFETKFLDPFISLSKKSKSSVIGRSLVFHFANSTRFACANIELASTPKLLGLQDAIIDTDYNQYINDELLQGYEFNEDEALAEEVFEPSQNFNYFHSERRVNSTSLVTSSNSSGNSSLPTIQNYESCSESNASGLNRGWFTALTFIVSLLF